MIARGSWPELVLVFVVVMAFGGLVVFGILVIALRKRPSWSLYAKSVAGAFVLVVLNMVWNMLAG